MKHLYLFRVEFGSVKSEAISSAIFFAHTRHTVDDELIKNCLRLYLDSYPGRKESETRIVSISVAEPEIVWIKDEV